MGNGGKDKDSESAQLVGGSKDLESGPDDESSKKCKETKSCGSKCLACFRCVFGFILFPFVFLLTLLAILVWIILLPGMLKRIDLLVLILIVSRSEINALWVDQTTS